MKSPRVGHKHIVDMAQQEIVTGCARFLQGVQIRNTMKSLQADIDKKTVEMRDIQDAISELKKQKKEFQSEFDLVMDEDTDLPPLLAIMFQDGERVDPVTGEVTH
jgi:hypothetical protein